MLLARLVAGRYGYSSEETAPPIAVRTASRGWLARLFAAISSVFA
jgi:hypothetical protein